MKKAENKAGSKYPYISYIIDIWKPTLSKYLPFSELLRCLEPSVYSQQDLSVIKDFFYSQGIRQFTRKYVVDNYIWNFKEKLNKDCNNSYYKMMLWALEVIDCAICVSGVDYVILD